MARYINPFSDWSFKRIFGQEYSKDLLIEFLNQLLLGEQHITNVKFKDKEMLPETKDQRGIIYDVFCTTDTGEHIIVEMQNKSQAYFIDRSLFYASKTIVDQGVKGQWDYHLTPVYVICFMNFDVDENTPKKFRTDVVLADKESGEVYSNKIRFIYLVMPLFKKKEEECNTFLDCWIYNLSTAIINVLLPKSTRAVRKRPSVNSGWKIWWSIRPCSLSRTMPLWNPSSPR